MPIEGLFIAIGYEPNTEAFRDWLEVDEKGYLVVHDETGSKIDGVFIAGDVHDHRYRQAVTAAARRLQGGHRRRALARGPGHHRSRDRDRLVMSFPRGRTRAATGGVGRGGGGGGGGGGAVRRRPGGRLRARPQGAPRPHAPPHPRLLQALPARRSRSSSSRSSPRASIGLVNPYLLKLLIDEAIPRRDCFLLNLYVGLMIVLPIVTGLIGVGQTYLNNVIGQNVMQDLRGALYAHLQRMPLRFFTETRTGEIQSRLANDVGGVQAVVTDTASSVTSNLAVAPQHGRRDVPHRLAPDRPVARAAAVLHVPDLPGRQGPPGGVDRDPEVAGRDVAP